MTPDHYAALGLSPTSEDVVIRAAYRALMRRYHPDANPSATAAARTRAINAAYAVLGDPDRRADYDDMRAEQAAGYEPEARRRAPPTGWFAAAAILLLLVLLPLAIWSPAPVRPLPQRTPAVQPEMVEREPSPLPAPAQALEPVQEPAQPHPPPPVAQAPSSRTESAPRLATALPAPAPKVRAAVQPSTSMPAPAVATAAKSNLANLDRQQALLFGQSWSRANSAKRAQLLSSRDRFIARRAACRSNACTSGVTLARMREVSEIMTGQLPPPQ